MSAKHTPGPWIADGSMVVETANGDCIARVDEFAPDDVVEANARLIAAAPLLISVLYAALEWAEPMKDAPKSSRPEWFYMARIAVAKATGAQ